MTTSIRSRRRPRGANTERAALQQSSAGKGFTLLSVVAVRCFGSHNVRYINRQSGVDLSRDLANVAQGVRRQYRVGVERNGRAAVPQPRGDSVAVQAAPQPVAGAAVAQAVGGRALDAGSGGGFLQSRFLNPFGNPAGRAPWG